MTYDYKLTCNLPAEPETVYAAWLDSKAHGEMTGAAATVAAAVRSAVQERVGS